MLSNVGAIGSHLTEGRSVVIGFADDDVDLGVAPCWEDGVVEGLACFERGVHDCFDYDGALVEEGAKGRGEILWLVLNDGARDKTGGPLEGAGP